MKLSKSVIGQPKSIRNRPSEQMLGAVYTNPTQKNITKRTRPQIARKPFKSKKVPIIWRVGGKAKPFSWHIGKHVLDTSQEQINKSNSFSRPSSPRKNRTTPINSVKLSFVMFGISYGRACGPLNPLIPEGLRPLESRHVYYRTRSEITLS